MYLKLHIKKPKTDIEKNINVMTVKHDTIQE